MDKRQASVLKSGRTVISLVEILILKSSHKDV